MSVLVGVVEDNHNIRKRLHERFAFFDEVALTLAAASGEAFLTHLEKLSANERPQVVLMDIELPRMSGIETTRQLKSHFPDIEVMMFTVFEDEDRIFESIKAGASGYLLKDSAADQIVAAILSLMRGGAPMSPAVAKKVLGFIRLNEQPSLSAKPEHEITFALSTREREILTLVVADETEAVIGDKLHISPHTVRTHIKNIYKKLHVHSRASAVRVTLEHQLLSR